MLRKIAILAITCVTLCGSFVARAHAGFDLQSFDTVFRNQDGAVDVQAGSHPWTMTTTLSFKTRSTPEGLTVSEGDIKDVKLELPAGFVGDPTAADKCSGEAFSEERLTPTGPVLENCPIGAQVGVARVTLGQEHVGEPGGVLHVAVYNLVPPPSVPAEFGFNAAGVKIEFTPRLRTGGDYGITVEAKNLNQALDTVNSTVTLWGVPGSAGHNSERGPVAECEYEELRACASGTAPKAFLTLPSACSGPLITNLYADGWQLPREVVHHEALSHDDSGNPIGVVGCDRLAFAPALTVHPGSSTASSPTGLTAELEVPQNSDPEGLASSDLRKAVVALPPGLTTNPSSADGRQGCTEAQIGMDNASVPTCPDASKVGSVEVETPLLETPLTGSVYLATPNANKFHSLLALYVVAEADGVLVKLAGQVVTDLHTGQVTTIFDENPQAPFSRLKLTLFGGSRAPLSTPAACGTYTTTAQLTPWSSLTPSTVTSPFNISSGCAGGFSPTLVAGTTDNKADTFSPLTVTLSRADQDQEFKSIEMRTPPGLLGMVSKVPLCQAAAAALGTCPQASQIGHVTVGAGVGPNPLFLPEPGKPQDPVYLTGPYEGAPFGLSIVVPAEAGPFNLGKVVVRAKVNIDPRTAQVLITTGPLPSILEGIPLRVRTANVVVDRKGFIFNPTNCGSLAISGTVTSLQGLTAAVSSHFQAADCAALAFKPKFTASTQAKTSRARGASLDVKVSYPKGAEANIQKVAVTLPKQLPSRLTTIQKACLAATFAANPASCPVASNVGTARVVTPVLNVPLTGPAYLVSHGGAAFPDLVIVLQGEGVTLDLTGAINISKHGITSSAFRTVPDAPFSSFELKLPEGSHSALTATLPAAAKGSLCATKLAIPTTLIAQNGRQIKQSTKIAVTGCRKSKKGRG